MQANPSFSVGDTAVYPAHGVADVVDVENKTVGGQTLSFYHLQVRNSGLKIIVPIARAEENGMRPLAAESDIEQVFELLNQREIEPDRQTWNRRYRGFMEKIRSGVLFEVAEVYRDLSILKCNKTLSHGEREMLRTARDLLAAELSAAHSTPQEEVEEKLDSMFKN